MSEPKVLPLLDRNNIRGSGLIHEILQGTPEGCSPDRITLSCPNHFGPVFLAHDDAGPAVVTVFCAICEEALFCLPIVEDAKSVTMEVQYTDLSDYGLVIDDEEDLNEE